ncbi:hypothetical protein QE152_g32208 [Popillia japonica]|uniref:Uncharacterized protein n=1 Tax=Popillia japonica TaxID=7064 RepID=A0AAW1IZW7_POPJA
MRKRRPLRGYPGSDRCTAKTLSKFELHGVGKRELIRVVTKLYKRRNVSGKEYENVIVDGIGMDSEIKKKIMFLSCF